MEKVGKGPVLPDAGDGCPWFCGSAEAEGRGLDVLSNGRDQMSPQAEDTAQTCLQKLLVPSRQMVVPSDKLT